MALQRQKRGVRQPAKVSIKLISKRTLYKLKKEVESFVAKATMHGNFFVLSLKSRTSPDDLVFGQLYDVLDSLGLNIPEDKVRISGNEAFIEE